MGTEWIQALMICALHGARRDWATGYVFVDAVGMDGLGASCGDHEGAVKAAQQGSACHECARVIVLAVDSRLICSIVRDCSAGPI